jgi:hypothetical protein
MLEKQGANPRDTARAFNIGRGDMMRAIRNGEIRVYRCGVRRICLFDDVREWIRANNYREASHVAIAA